MSVCFFGGTFDPPHKGHLAIINECIKFSDKFILFPSKQTPLKKYKPVAKKLHRLRMLELLIKNIDFPIIIDKYEINYSKSNFTIDTIKYLKKKYPGQKLLMVIGSDNLVNFKDWKEYEKILDMTEIIVFNRSQEKIKKIKSLKINYIQDFNINISSSKIRENFSNRILPVQELTKQVLTYIQFNNLYGISSDYR